MSKELQARVEGLVNMVNSRDELLAEIFDENMKKNIAAAKAAGMTRVTLSLPVDFLERAMERAIDIRATQ